MSTVSDKKSKRHHVHTALQMRAILEIAEDMEYYTEHIVHAKRATVQIKRAIEELSQTMDLIYKRDFSDVASPYPFPKLEVKRQTHKLVASAVHKANQKMYEQ